MKIKELKDRVCENYYKQVGFPRESSYYSNEMSFKKRFTIICNQIN